MINSAKSLRMVVGMCSLCMECVLDKNKTSFSEFFKDVSCLLKKLIFQDTSLVDFQFFNPKLLTNEKIPMGASQVLKRKTVDYDM